MASRLLFLCTCTGLESATAAGVTGYLLYLGMPIIALIAAVIFAKLIVFHVIMDYYDKRSGVPVAAKWTHGSAGD